jgi:starch synthase (maltosyl-transferring)
MRPAKPFLPRIYYLDPRLLRDTSQLDLLLEHCGELGFDHVLVPAGSDTGMLAKACAARKLKLLLDMDMRATAEDASLAERHPDWFEQGEALDDLPDPRRPPRRPGMRRLRIEQTDVAVQVAAHWREQLLTAIRAGVAGFRCMGLAEISPSQWKGMLDEIRAAHPQVRFLAWTPGCTPAHIEALADCPFDATFSSGAWWDFRSRWLADEQARLARIAPAIAFPDSPDEPVVGRITGNEESSVRRKVYLRALGLATAAGNGLMVTMGFEYGASGLTVPLGGRPGWDEVREQAPFDLSAEIAQANAFVATGGSAFYGNPFRIISSPNAGVAMLLRDAIAAPNAPRSALLVAANADTSRACSITESQLLERAGGYIRHSRVWPGGGEVQEETDTPVALEAGDFQMYAVHKPPPILLPPPRGKQAVTAAAKSPRIAIEAVSPSVDGGKFPVKRTVGESVSIEADVFADGHDKLAVVALWRTADEAEWHEIRMHPLGNDRWAATLPLTRIGRYLFDWPLPVCGGGVARCVFHLPRRTGKENDGRFERGRGTGRRPPAGRGCTGPRAGKRHRGSSEQPEDLR